jgi:uncharacterized protein (TIGR00251 family)
VTKILAKVIPKSSRSGVKIEESVIKVWLHSPPADGQANDELVLILAKKLEIAKSHVRILRGFSSRTKTVDILGLSMDEIEKRLV